MAERFCPPGFDQQKAAEECTVGFCGPGNAALPDGEGSCTYMEQTEPLINPDSPTPAELASDPKWAGHMRDKCPFGAEVYHLRTGK